VLGVAFAFGLTVLTMAFAIGHISGCHLNPAVSFGLVVGGRFPAKELLPYVIAQVIGAILAGVIYSSPVARPASSCQRGWPRTATPTIRPAAIRWVQACQ
jgi:glycerol uptake facilitator-like aquaporin